MPIIIDGWNLIIDASSRIDDDRDDHLAGARELIACLEEYQHDRKDPITVVFDSRYEHLDMYYENTPALKIVPARNADEYIKKHIDSVSERQRRNMRVVSSEFWEKLCRKN